MSRSLTSLGEWIQARKWPGLANEFDIAEMLETGLRLMKRNELTEEQFKAMIAGAIHRATTKRGI